MTALQLYKISNHFQWAGSVLIAICCLTRYSSRALHIKMLGFYAMSSIIFSFAQSIVPAEYSIIWNNPIGNGFVLSETLLLGLLYYHATQNKSFRRGILISLVLYITFYGLVFLLFIDNSFSYIRLSRDLLLILYSIAYFYYLIRALPEEYLLKLPMFWINAAIIFYFSGTFILSFFRDYLVTVLKDDTSGFWAFRNFFRFTFCCVLAYASWLDLRSINKSSSP